MRWGIRTGLVLVSGIVAFGSLMLGSPAEAATGCESPHCYSVLGRGFSPGATEIWTHLSTWCATLDGTPSGHDNNEMWALTSGAQNWVEFGHRRDVIPGIPGSHWFWARVNNGTEQAFYLSNPYVNKTVYNATIKWTGSAGLWQFYQGGSLFGQGVGSYPAGPIIYAELGAEMESNTTSPQLSIYDSDSGRIQNGVSYSNWANPPRIVHDVPPFDTAGTFGDTWISDANRSVGGAGGC